MLHMHVCKCINNANCIISTAFYYFHIELLYIYRSHIFLLSVRKGHTSVRAGGQEGRSSIRLYQFIWYATVFYSLYVSPSGLYTYRLCNKVLKLAFYQIYVWVLKALKFLWFRIILDLNLKWIRLLKLKHSVQILIVQKAET